MRKMFLHRHRFIATINFCERKAQMCIRKFKFTISLVTANTLEISLTEAGQKFSTALIRFVLKGCINGIFLLVYLNKLYLLPLKISGRLMSKIWFCPGFSVKICCGCLRKVNPFAQNFEFWVLNFCYELFHVAENHSSKIKMEKKCHHR